MEAPRSRLTSLLEASGDASLAPLIRAAAHVSLPARVPPWTGTGVTLRRGDHVTILAGAPAIALRVEASAGITRHPLDVALAPGTFLEWTWRVNALPSPGREDTFATHDYTSIALEFDDGRDLTWYWSAAIPVEEHYDGPLPRWAGIETHLVIRSGSHGLGTWLDERRDVHTDVARALGRVPARIVAVWLIGVCLFQGGAASTDVRRIALVQDGRTRTVFPA